MQILDYLLQSDEFDMCLPQVESRIRDPINWNVTISPRFWMLQEFRELYKNGKRFRSNRGETAYYVDYVKNNDELLGQSARRISFLFPVPSSGIGICAGGVLEKGRNRLMSAILQDLLSDLHDAVSFTH